MVKNKIGGNKAKRQGRKFVGTVSSKLRVAIEEGEIYAVVIKHFGNAMMDVLCIDGIQRICVIRNKFRGRGKRDNCVNVGNWILIGKREWEIVDSYKKEKCDLLEVYNQSDVEQLKKLPNNWKILTAAIETEEPQDDNVLFTNKDNEYDKSGNIEDFSGNNIVSIQDNDDDEIDFDDI